MKNPSRPPFRVRARHAVWLGACSVLHLHAEEAPTPPPAAPALEIGVQRVNNDTLGVGGITLEQDDTAFRLVGDHSSRAEHLLLGGGIRLGQRHHLVGGISVGREPIPGRDARMKGHSAVWRLSAAQPIQGVRQWFIEGLHQSTESRRISVTDTPFSESSSETDGLTTRTTRTEGVWRCTEWFHGGRRTELSATAEANIGDHAIAALRWLYGRTRLLDERDTYQRMRLTYQRYLPGYDANWTVGVDNKGRLQLGAEKRLDGIDATAVLMAFKNTRDDTTHGVYLGLRFELGDTPSQPGQRPDANVALLRDAVRTLYAPQNYFGTLLEQEERIVTSQTVETTVKKRANTRTESPDPQAEEPATPAEPEEPTVPGEPTPPPVTPEPDPAPTEITLAQSNTLVLLELGAPTPTQIVLSSPVTAGQLSCTDVATAPRTANTCSFSGGNPLIAVTSDGTVTYGAGPYTPGSFSISVAATDQAGNTYTQTVALNHEVQSP